jgi:peptidoglycan/LPS O-acetylase OafA/YrhL
MASVTTSASSVKAGPPARAGRIPYLESVRGIAAAQVFLMHLVTAFAPSLVLATLADHSLAGYIRASPLSQLYNGNSAVYFFFILSGYVLTPAFAAYTDRPLLLLASRIARLAVPAFAARVLAALIFACCGDVHRLAGNLIGSAWLSDGWLPDQGPLAVLRDGIVNAVFVGYREIGTAATFGLLPDFLQPLGKSYVQPFWTLSIELFGSLLVLIMVVIRQRIPRAWLATLICLALVLVWTPFLGFFLGHVAATRRLAERDIRGRGTIITALIAAGALLLADADFGTPDFMNSAGLWSQGLHLPCPNAYHFEKTVGAASVLLGLLLWPGLRRVLSLPLFVALGRLSFPVYLVHWPIVLGLGSVVVVFTYPTRGASGAASAAIVVALLLVAIAAFLFEFVDDGAVQLSRWMRRWRPRPGGTLMPAAGRRPASAD